MQSKKCQGMWNSPLSPWAETKGITKESKALLKPPKKWSGTSMQVLTHLVNLSEDGLSKRKNSERLKNKEWTNWSKPMRSSTKKVRRFLTKRSKRPKRYQLFPFRDLTLSTRSKLTLKFAKKESKLWEKWRRKKMKLFSQFKKMMLKLMLAKMNKFLRKKWHKLSNKLLRNCQTTLTAQRMLNLLQKDKNLPKRTKLSQKMQLLIRSQLPTPFN